MSSRFSPNDRRSPSSAPAKTVHHASAELGNVLAVEREDVNVAVIRGRRVQASSARGKWVVAFACGPCRSRARARHPDSTTHRVFPIAASAPRQWVRETVETGALSPSPNWVRKKLENGALSACPDSLCARVEIVTK